MSGGYPRAALEFKPALVASYRNVDPMGASVGFGIEDLEDRGRHVAVAVCLGTGDTFAALLLPDEAEDYAHRVLRAAAEARSEGRA